MGSRQRQTACARQRPASLGSSINKIVTDDVSRLTYAFSGDDCAIVAGDQLLANISKVEFLRVYMNSFADGFKV